MLDKSYFVRRIARDAVTSLPRCSIFTGTSILYFGNDSIERSSSNSQLWTPSLRYIVPKSSSSAQSACSRSLKLACAGVHSVNFSRGQTTDALVKHRRNDYLVLLTRRGRSGHRERSRAAMLVTPHLCSSIMTSALRTSPHLRFVSCSTYSMLLVSHHGRVRSGPD